MTPKKKLAIALGAVLAIGVGGAFALVSRGHARLYAEETPYPDLAASKDPAVIERGRYLVNGPAHCTQCHGDYARSNPSANVADLALSGGFEFAMGPLGTMYASNLTPDDTTGIGRRSDKELARTLRHGVLSDGRISFFMRHAASRLSDEDTVAVLSYLRSREPIQREIPEGGFAPFGKALMGIAELGPNHDPAPKHVPESSTPSVERGEYLAEHVVHCVGCHSAFDPLTFQASGPKAGGALPDPSHGDDKDKEFAAPNLTSDPKTGVTGKLDEEQFVTRLRAGRAFVSSIMAWENIGRMSDADLRSIYRYLRTLPPVENDVGPTYRDQGWKKPG
jgi:mono/diheme cytochrome c family protein